MVGAMAVVATAAEKSEAVTARVRAVAVRAGVRAVESTAEAGVPVADVAVPATHSPPPPPAASP